MAFVSLLALSPPPAAADATYGCDRSGGSATIVDACAVRWSAANIRAHLAAGSFGGSSKQCLSTTASFLDGLAAKWIAAGKETNYTLPCGKPSAMNADDGLLARACPNRSWTYANRGAPGCSYAMMVAAFHRPSSSTAAAQTTSGPSYDETAQWLADNVQMLANAQGPNNNALHTTSFSITKCVVSYASHTDAGYDWAVTIPFSEVTGVFVVPDPNWTGVQSVKIVTKGGGAHQTLPSTRDYDSTTIVSSSPASAQRMANAFTRLAELCRAQKEPF